MGSPSYPPGRPKGDSPTNGASNPSKAPIWSLTWRGRTFTMGEAPTVLGRSSQCEIHVDDPLVSRRHVMIQVSGDALFLEDLRSANGVFVNGERVRRPRRLCEGDRVLLGNEEFVVTLSAADGEPAVRFGDEPRTLDPEAQSDVHDVVPSKGRSLSRGSSPGATTEKAEAFTMLSRLADRLLAEGHPDRAVRVLSELLREVLDAARTGFDVSEDAYDHACDCAAKLAEATSDGRWVDYLVELHLALRQPLSAALIQSIKEAIERGVEIDVALFERYQGQVREIRTVAKPAERQLCDLSLEFHPVQRS